VFTDLQGDAAALSSLGVVHGDMVYLLYHFERDVRPAYQRSEFEKRPFGAWPLARHLHRKHTAICVTACNMIHHCATQAVTSHRRDAALQRCSTAHAESTSYARLHLLRIGTAGTACCFIACSTSRSFQRGWHSAFDVPQVGKQRLRTAC